MSILHIAFYPSDWLAGTRGLSDAETGVYITLIARMYEMAAPIERDDNRLARLCGCKSRAGFVKSLEYLISEGKITESNGSLFNERVEKEIKITTQKSDKAKTAAESRWSKKPNKNNGGDNADASPKHMPQQCQLEPEPELRIEVDKSTSCSFDEFWKVWPNKSSKPAARRAWKKLSRADQKTVIGCAASWFKAWRKQNPDCSPILPASFLNGERWLDEGVAVPKADPEEMLKFYADWVNGEKFISPSAIKPQVVSQLLSSDMVSESRMKERGLI